MKPLPKLVLTALSLSLVNTGYAANSNYQNYLFSACASAIGLLGQRCSLTNNGEGDVSGDSESSLNPNQSLSVNDISLESARGQSQVQDNDESDVDLLRVEIGPVGGFLNLKAGRLESDRSVDNNREREYSTDSFGFDIGVDYQLEQGNYLGAILGYETNTLNFVEDRPGVNFNPVGNAGGIDSESISLMAFGHLEIGNGVFVNANIGYAGQSIDIERNAVFQESGRQEPQVIARTTADTDGTSQWLSLGLGYRMEMGAWQILPNAGWTLSQAKVDGYTETDLNASGLHMTVSASERDSSRGELGIAVSRVINTGGVVLNPQFRVAYEREFSRDPDNVRAKYVLDGSDDSMVLRNDNIDTSQLYSAASVSLVAPNGWLAFVDTGVIWSNDLYSGWQVTAGIRKEI